MVINFGPGGGCQCTGGTGCSLTSITQTYTGSDTYNISKPQGFDGFSAATITVNVPTPELEEKSYSITGNGVTLIEPTSGKYISGGTITVSVPLTEQNISITANGDTLITVPQNYAGITGGTITVNVPSQPFSGWTFADLVNGSITSITDSDLVGERILFSNSLRNVKTLNSTSVTGISSSVFSDCRIQEVYAPNCQYVYANAFSYCYELTAVTLSSSFISLDGRSFAGDSNLKNFNNGDFSSIKVFNANNAFADCTSLTGDVVFNSAIFANGGFKGSDFYHTGINSFTFPSNTDKIGSASYIGNIFANCSNVQYFDFTACEQVPTLSNISSFSNLPASYEIRVPASLYNDWIAASNWSDSSIVSHIVAVQ